ncbi:putative sporulation-specific glycosylase YdhD [compost metagenome]
MKSYITRNGLVRKLLLSTLLLMPLTSGGSNHVMAQYISSINSNKVATAITPFEDISTSYAKESIINMYRKGYLAGTDSQHFSPYAPVTRAEWTTIINRILQLQGVNASVPIYRDVKQGTWYYPQIQAAAQLGIVQGDSASFFHPQQPIHRQEAAVILSRLLPASVERSTVVNTCPSYQDSTSISEWAQDAVCSVSGRQWMTGHNGYFRPQAILTRQEAAVLLEKVMSNVSSSQASLNSSTRPIQLGWQYNQSTEAYEHSVMNSNINTLSPRWFYTEKNGQLANYADHNLLDWADKNNKQLWPMLGNHSDASLTHDLLSSPSKVTALIQQITTAANTYELDGIVMDFENVNAEDRQQLTAFVRKLSAQLHEHGAVLAICVSPDQGSEWTAAFDYRALGSSADYIILMGYDEHWAGRADPGSVSSLPWLRQGLTRLLASVPADQVILGLPLYTRDWAVTPTQSTDFVTDITLNEQVLRLPLMTGRLYWNEALGQYQGDYMVKTQKHKLWLEESRSLGLKYMLGTEAGIRGFAYWYTGAAGDDVWASLRNAQTFADRRFMAP